MEVLKKFLTTKSEKKKFGQIIDAVYVKRPMTHNNVSALTHWAIGDAKILAGDNCLAPIQNMRMFAIRIGAIRRDYNNELPDHLCFVAEIKALYELHRMYGPKYSSILPKPIVSTEEILRPLEEHEVIPFHDFCKRNPLTA
jgi:hypothetical protein